MVTDAPEKKIVATHLLLCSVTPARPMWEQGPLRGPLQFK